VRVGGGGESDPSGKKSLNRSTMPGSVEFATGMAWDVAGIARGVAINNVRRCLF
jgi:hypothetical protein